VSRGAERTVRDLADGLIARGHSPRLITSHPGPPSRSVEDGLPVTRHWRPPDGRLRRRRYEDHLTHVPFSYLSLRRGDDEVAHAHYPTDALAAARWSRRTGRPSILTYHGIPSHAGLVERRLRVRILLRAARGCDALTVVSEAAAAAFRRWLGLEARVIHPGVDLRAFAPMDGRAPGPTILCPAPIEEARKRVELVVGALPLVRRERGDARLLLLRPRDPALAGSLEATPGVELFDAVAEPRELAPLYARASAVVLPAVAEALGLVLVEALACGTPVVGRDADGIPEVVDSDAIGRLFDGDDERALARAILETLALAEDPSTAAACRRRAEAFSVERMVEGYEGLYRELLESRGG
jgi:phosphatidylinositol alpha-mannosyltransferase